MTIAESWEAMYELLFRGRIYEWLGEHWDIQSSAYTKKGLFKVEESRHLIALFDSYQSEHVRETNVLAPTRGGKTMWMDGCHLWGIKIRPGSTLVLFQEEKAVADQAETRTWSNVSNCKPVAAKLSNRSADNRNTEIILPNMYFHIRGPSDSNLSSRGYQNVWVDEPWLLKEGKIEEARARLGDYEKLGTDKFQCLSQGGVVGSEWDRQYNRGLIHEWHVECQKCGHYMVPRWTGYRPDGETTWGMKWDTHKQASGLWDVTKCLQSVRFECEKCGHPHLWSPRLKNEWNRTGKYIPEGDTKDPKRESFHWTAVIDTPWPGLVDAYLQAINAWKTGITEPLIKFFQKRMAEMSSEERLLQNSLSFRKEKVELNDRPEGSIRIITADRQEEDVYWVMACDWTRATEESKPKVKRIYYGKCFSAAEIEELRIKLGVEKNHVLIDSGYRPKGDHGVYSYCIKYGWIPTKGEATQSGEEVWYTHDIDGVRVHRTFSEAIVVDAESGIGGGRYTELIKFSAPTYTARVQWLIDHGMWIEPDDADDPMGQECRKQMASEFLKEIVIGNKQARRTKKIYVCPSGNNHARDDAKQQVLAAVLLDVLPDLESLDDLAG